MDRRVIGLIAIQSKRRLEPLDMIGKTLTMAPGGMPCLTLFADIRIICIIRIILLLK